MPDEFTITEHDMGETNQDQDWVSSPIVVRTDKTLVVKDKFLATDSEVQILLGQRVNRTATGANYTLSVIDYVVGVTSLVNAISIGLPKPTSASVGKSYIIKDEVGGASTTAITVRSDGERTIDGATSLSINTNYASYCLYSDGTNWFIDKNYLSNLSPASPIDFYGDGSDGAVVLDGVNTYSFLTLSGSTYSLQRDTYFTNVTINSAIFLNPAGYSIFINGTLTRAGTGMISFNGGNGGDATAGGTGGGSVLGGAGGSAGAAVVSGTLPISPAGQSGGAGGGTGDSGSSSGVNGNNGGTSTNGLGVDGVTGASGGKGGNASFTGAIGGAGGNSGSAGATVLIPHDYTPLRLLSNWISGSWIRYGANGGSGGGGGGGGGSRNSAGAAGGGSGGGGGGSGSAGGFIAAYIRAIVAVNTNVLFQANGGSGGSGANGGMGHTANNSAGGGGGSGGSGGSGGVVVLIYGSSDKAVTSVIQVNGGSGGAKGTGGASGGAGANAGDDGVTGTVGLVGTTYILNI